MPFDLDHYFNNREQHPDGIPVAALVVPPPSFTMDATEQHAPYILEKLAWRLDVAGRQEDAYVASILAQEMREWQAKNPDLVKGSK